MYFIVPYCISYNPTVLYYTAPYYSAIYYNTLPAAHNILSLHTTYLLFVCGPYKCMLHWIEILVKWFICKALLQIVQH